MKNIRSNYIKDSLLDYDKIANSIKENTSATIRDILSETVRNTYGQILSEANEDDYEEDEVKDTLSSQTTSDEDEVNNDETEKSEEEEDIPEEPEETEEVDDVIDSESETADVSEDDRMADFDEYKIGDDEYDFSNAKDEDIVKVFKRLEDTDQVFIDVDKENHKVELKDNETGTEYLIDLGSSYDENEDDDEVFVNNDDDNMTNESRIFEIVLESDSKLGYTDDYQKKDVMTTDSMTEPGKNVNNWDKGVPTGTSKPWAGKAGDMSPFSKKVQECGINTGDMIEDEENLEEGGHVYGKVQAHSTAKTYKRSNPSGDAYQDEIGSASQEGDYKGRGLKSEAKMLKKVNKILKENEQLKAALANFKTVLQEAAVTNVNLGQIIKLISENSTTKDEKKEIIERFGKYAKTVKQSKELYEAISSELKKNASLNINEEKQFTANSSKKINETKIYKSSDMDKTLDLMHRMCK